MKIDADNNVVRISNLENSVAGVRQEEQTGAVGKAKAAVYSENKQMLVERASENIQKDKDAGQETAGQDSCTKNLEILANTATEEDISKLSEEGMDVEEESVDVIVTVVDKIKAKLATYCDDYAGDTEDLSVEQLEKISGDSMNTEHIEKKLKQNNLPVTKNNVNGISDAMKMSADITGLSENAKAYAVKNNLELTVENLYTAEYSSTDKVSCPTGSGGYYEEGIGSYYSKNAQELEFAKLGGSVKKVIEQAGLEVNDETMGQARWLMERQIPLNVNTISKLHDIEQIDFPVDEEMVLDRMIQAVMDGKSPVQAQLAKSDSAEERAANVCRVAAEATEEQIQTIAYGGQEITIAALAQLQNGNQTNTVLEEDTLSDDEKTEADVSCIRAKRQLEEIRLRMTIQAGAAMIKNGITIETADLGELVENLKKLEDSYYGRLLEAGEAEPTQKNIDSYRAITFAVQNIAASPAEILGIETVADTKQTVGTISRIGSVIQAKYEAAESAYETVMTKPRSDMGDSISKAFQNVDDIVEDMDLELTEENRRAVRILGYNSIEISEENLFRVKAVDKELNALIRGMTPSRVVNMIRDGYNPLNETISNVNEKLSEYGADSVESEEKYSEYLYKLENSDAISEDERNAYIGIYRLLHQVQKSDGAVVGALVMQGADVTMQNLMMGVRTRKHSAMDYRVDDTTQLKVNAESTGSITGQIENGFAGMKTAYYNRLVDEAIDNLTPQALNSMMEASDVMNMSLENFAEFAAQSDEDSQKEQYNNEKLDRIQEGAHTEEQVLEFLSNHSQTISLNNISAAESLLFSAGKMFLQLAAQSKKDENFNSDYEESTSKLEEAFTDEESAQDAYDNFTAQAEKVLEDGIEGSQVDYAEMRNWKLLHSQINLARNLSRQEQYFVPMDLDGETTAVRVSFVRGGYQPKVSVTTETEGTGRLAAEFSMYKGSVNAYYVSNTKEGGELLQEVSEIVGTQVSAANGLEVNNSSCMVSDKLDLNRFSSNRPTEETQQEKVSSEDLYLIAKTFLKALHMKRG